jgi:glycosyltransferase involved in cell wall biosynthesis
MLDPYFKRAFPLKHARNWIYWLANDFHLLRHAHRVLFTTETERELAEQSFSLRRWKPLVVPLGALEQPPPSPSDHEAFLELCPGLGDARFLLFLGRIHPKKGCDLLIEAFARVQALDPELHLVIAGPDPAGMQPKLAALAAQLGIAPRVHWTGMLSGGIKQAAFNATDAFILPSHQENFGIAVAEALAAGRPVLLSDKVNIACDVAADGAGLVGSDTVEGTVAVLTRWLNLDAAARQHMAQQARNTFLNRYDMRQNASAILQAFTLSA